MTEKKKVKKATRTILRTIHKAKKPNKKRPQDATIRNVRASQRRDSALVRRLQQIEKRLDLLQEDLTMLDERTLPESVLAQAEPDSIGEEPADV